MKRNKDLQDKIKSAADADAVRAIAKESGLTMADNDLRITQSKSSDEELEGTAEVIDDRTWNGKIMLKGWYI
ncbi:Nif11-like leader peptide family RiPP precursor [Synechococcus sp. BIOS-E4-1]|uniref:Nif11-like leader peptide family RiPP precursor n=1 Tax=Synechococcus sp. BIOS-E4-1 TaxID=1400864 RepID=UPI0021038383|nr:Nif11-like leader peptide family RiPP precursor [Synechococcus sp. BIOS-E4-1]